MVLGRPWPPNSDRVLQPCQPPSANWRNASPEARRRGHHAVIHDDGALSPSPVQRRGDALVELGALLRAACAVSAPGDPRTLGSWPPLFQVGEFSHHRTACLMTGRSSSSRSPGMNEGASTRVAGRWSWRAPVSPAPARGPGAVVNGSATRPVISPLKIGASGSLVDGDDDRGPSSRPGAGSRRLMPPGDGETAARRSCQSPADLPVSWARSRRRRRPGWRRARQPRDLSAGGVRARRRALLAATHHRAPPRRVLAGQLRCPCPFACPSRLAGGRFVGDLAADA